MKLNSRAIILVIAATLLFGGAAFWFLNNFELVDEEVFTPPEKEARRNPFLAAERLVQQNGINVESVSGQHIFDSLPPETDTIFMSNHNSVGLMSDARQQEIYNWINGGGHLITVIHSLWDDENNSSGDPFLDSFGIRQYYHNIYENGDENEETELNIVETKFAGLGETLKIEFLPNYYMVDTQETAFVKIEGLRGIQLLQIAIGSGVLTVMTDDRMWRNQQIGDHDHALFFYNLMGYPSFNSEVDHKVWIIHDLDFPSLPTLIWHYAPAAVIALTTLLLFSLWAAYNRFGPALIIYSHKRRSLLEHLDACGRYHWRTNRGDELINTLRENVQQLLEKLHPEWRQLEPQQQIEWINKRTQHPTTKLKRALTGYAEDETEFLDIIQTLQHLRKTL